MIESKNITNFQKSGTKKPPVFAGGFLYDF